jgi:hypothetical protein
MIPILILLCWTVFSSWTLVRFLRMWICTMYWYHLILLYVLLSLISLIVFSVFSRSAVLPQILSFRNWVGLILFYTPLPFFSHYLLKYPTSLKKSLRFAIILIIGDFTFYMIALTIQMLSMSPTY